MSFPNVKATSVYILCLVCAVFRDTNDEDRSLPEGAYSESQYLGDQELQQSRNYNNLLPKSPLKGIYIIKLFE